jgi:iron complex transport system permease protein
VRPCDTGRFAVPAALAGLGLALIVGAACLGAVHLPPSRALAAIVEGARGGTSWEALVVWRVRVPRAIVAYLVGGALAVSGGALQGLFRNPLAEPGVLGVSNGAALAAVLAIFSGLAARAPAALPLAACAGALAVTVVLLVLAARGRRTGVGDLLLAGVALANLAAAGTTLVLSFSLASYDVGRQVLAWMLGGLEGRTWAHVAMGGAPILGALAMAIADARHIDALALGDVFAAGVGVPIARVRARVVLATAVLTGATVAIGGAIGFVGLIAPHVVRPLVGPSHARLLPACFLAGGAFLVAADVVARTVLAPQELRLGVVTAAVGAPLFLMLLLRRRPQEAW